jgi:hypothetical protein
MSSARITILLLSLSFIGGCNFLEASKLIAPQAFGLRAVSPRIYVEDGADEATRAKLSDAMNRAEQAIRSAYGSVKSRPVVHACVSERCYEAFGGGSSVAKVYGERILLSPRGLDWHFIAHEWSHAELSSRLTLSAWWYMPRWFDEGVAVAISEAPKHSEDHWQFLVTSKSPRPTPEELHALRSMRQWLDAVHRYGEDKNSERKARGEPELSPLYAAAGHEVRLWLTDGGSLGLLALIESLNRGEDFDHAYEIANPSFRRNASGGR